MSSKKDKKVKDNKEERLKALQEAHLKESKEYKERVQPLVRFLRGNKLRFNHAHVGQERVEYFRLDEFQKLVAENADKIKDNEQLNKLIKNASDEFVFFKRPEGINIKYPKALEPVLASNPDKKYASFRFDTTESNKRMTILVISCVLVLVLFPIWPFTVKYILWLISLVLLVILVGIIIVRLIVFLLSSVFNYNVWIFPNLFFANGLLDSFIPVIEISKGDKSWLDLFIRLFAISFFLLLSTHIYLNPTFFDEHLQLTKATIEDVHDWGVSKLKKEGNFSQRALTNLQEILNQTAEVKSEQTIQVNNENSYDNEGGEAEQYLNNDEQHNGDKESESTIEQNSQEGSGKEQQIQDQI